MEWLQKIISAWQFPRDDRTERVVLQISCAQI